MYGQNQGQGRDESIWLGNGREVGRYGDVVISVDMAIAGQYVKHITDKQGRQRQFLNLKVTKKREPDQYGKTHGVKLDTWEPGQNQPQNGGGYYNNPPQGQYQNPPQPPQGSYQQPPQGTPGQQPPPQQQGGYQQQPSQQGGYGGYSQ